MPLFRLDLEYHGARYRGWQVQQNAQGVANLVQDACRKVFGGLDELQAAGRTDSGVHALQQVAHLRAPWTERRPPDKRKINDLLPADIAVRSISPAPSDFHARHSAVKRVYLYQVMRRRSAFAHDITWWVKDQLDVGIIRQAAGHFCGLHDFRSFCQQDAGKKENTRILLESLDIK